MCPVTRSHICRRFGPTSTPQLGPHMPHPTYNTALVSLKCEGATGEAPGTNKLAGEAKLLDPSCTTIEEAQESKVFNEAITNAIKATNENGTHALHACLHACVLRSTSLRACALAHRHVLPVRCSEDSEVQDPAGMIMLLFSVLNCILNFFLFAPAKGRLLGSRRRAHCNTQAQALYCRQEVQRSHRLDVLGPFLL